MGRKISAVVLAILLSVSLLSCAPARPQRPPKVAVVLGAGAARGFAHVGVLKILESQKIPVNIIVGTSAGSFVGGLYAYGYNSFDLQRIALDIQKSDLADVSIFSSGGLIKGDRLEEYFNKAVNKTPIEQFRIPFAAVATDIQSGNEMVFSRGNAGAAVRASCSIPGIFVPARVGDRVYVDGGVVNPLAVDVARAMGADIVIAVDISSDMDTTVPEGMIDTILQSITVMYSKLSKQQLARADIIVRPRVGHIRSSEFIQRNSAIMEGERATISMIPAIQNSISNFGGITQ